MAEQMSQMGRKRDSWRFRAFGWATVSAVVACMFVVGGQIVRLHAKTEARFGITQDGDYLIYPATVRRIVDGDTVDVSFRVWDNIIVEERIRLLGVDAPEVRGVEKPEGLITSAWLSNQLDAGPMFLKSTGKRGKYGRTLGILMVRTNEKLVDLNQKMIDDGFAVPYR